MSSSFRRGSALRLVAGCVVALAVGAPALAADPPELQALKKATADGKYTNLLAVIHVPADKGSYGDFKDYGSSSFTEWAGYKGLPKGYWVYVAPHWYIWDKMEK